MSSSQEISGGILNLCGKKVMKSFVSGSVGYPFAIKNPRLRISSTLFGLIALVKTPEHPFMDLLKAGAPVCWDPGFRHWLSLIAPLRGLAWLVERVTQRSGTSPLLRADKSLSNDSTVLQNSRESRHGRWPTFQAFVPTHKKHTHTQHNVDER